MRERPVRTVARFSSPANSHPLTLTLPNSPFWLRERKILLCSCGFQNKNERKAMADVSVWVKSDQTSSERRINPNWTIAGTNLRRRGLTF